MKKLAVIFPGVGYNKDRPLLYYAARLATEQGFELKKISFDGMTWDKETRRDHKKLLEALNFGLSRVEETLSEVDFSEYERIVFFSKSIGTVAASAFAQKKDLAAKQVFFTPLEEFGSFVKEGGGLVFYGGADPYAQPDQIARICEEKQLSAHRIDGANHSLETDDALANIDILKQVMERVRDYVSERSIYHFSVLSQDGALTRLSDYRGKALLIVNTATGCGFTPQYERIEGLYRSYKKYGFEVLDFPCDQFGHQAPGTNQEIHSFCTARYDISFPQFAKTEVNGEHELELYTYLKEKQGYHGLGEGKDAEFMKKHLAKENPDFEKDDSIKWNFTKFLVDKEGTVVARFEPTEDMDLLEEKIREVLF